MKHAVSAIQFNLLFQIQLISVIKLMNWILSAENVRLEKMIATKMSLKHAEIAQHHFNTSVIKQILSIHFADNALLENKIVS